MKIEDNRPLGLMKFRKLDVGDCFIFEDEYYLKIDTSSIEGNAFSLRKDCKCYINGDKVVTFVHAKVVIYGYQEDV